MREDTVCVVQDCRRSATEDGFTSEHKNLLLDSLVELRKLGYKIRFECLVPRFMSLDKKPKKKDFDDHKHKFAEKIRILKPKFIVMLGGFVTGSLTGKPRFKNWKSKKLPLQDFVTVPIYHPTYAVKTKERQKEWLAQIKCVVSIIKNHGHEGIPTNYNLYTKEDSIVERLAELAKMEEHQAFDWETSHLEPKLGSVVCLSVSYDVGEADVFYFFKSETRKIREAVIGWLICSVPKIAHNAKFERKWALEHYEVEINNIVGDTQLMHHLLEEEMANNLSILSYIYTDMGGYDSKMTQFLEEGNKHHEASPEFMLPYSAGDSDCTRRLFFIFEPMIVEGGFVWINNNVVLPAMRTLSRMEHRGIGIDEVELSKVEANVLSEMSLTNSDFQKEYEVKNTLKLMNVGKKGSQIVGELNVDSPTQLKKLLFETCGIKPTKMTAKKNPSTDKGALECLKDSHPIVNKILRLRELGHYLIEVEEIKSNIRPDGTVTSNFWQSVVVTGRLSSRDPNLQNMTTGSPVRRCFISKFPGGKILESDFSQLELRLCGSESNQESWIESYSKGVDLHDQTATGLYNIPIEKVTKEQRTVAKRINFGVIYGTTKYGLAEQIGITTDEAQEHLDKYWLTARGIKKWMDFNVLHARRKGEVRNRFGRRRHVLSINSDKWWIKEAAERTASNSKIQSLGSDFTLWSLAKVDEEIIVRSKAWGLRSEVVLQVHDSIVTDIYPGEEEEIMELITEIMEEKLNQTFTFLRIPMVVEHEIGDNWLDKKAVGTE